MLVITGRITMLGLSRWTEKGGSYRSIQRFYHSILLRRDAPDRGAVIRVGDLTLDPAHHAVERAGRRIDLTSKEFALIEYLMRNANLLITREMAEAHVWSYDYDGASNVVDVYIRRLRRKIDDPFEVKLLETVRGAGYRLSKPLVPVSGS